MILCHTPQEVRDARRPLSGDLGFVPTMGCLHEGHMSLVRQAARENAHVGVSIFVNPVQFGPQEDFAAYPRTMEDDLELLRKEGVSLVFLPRPQEIYPQNPHLTWVEVSELDRNLCGAKRPGHFRGVCTVVTILLNIVMPDRVYFGQKDAQQAIILKRMIADLHLSVAFRSGKTVRDSDGLALSSRNRYLTPPWRRKALAIPQSLAWARGEIAAGQEDTAYLLEGIKCRLQEGDLRVDYVQAVDLETLQPLGRVHRNGTLVALAAFAGTTRLIDNFILGDL